MTGIIRMTSNSREYDAKLLAKEISYTRIGEYITSTTPILHKCNNCGTEILKEPKKVLKVLSFVLQNAGASYAM